MTTCTYYSEDSSNDGDASEYFEDQCDEGARHDLDEERAHFDTQNTAHLNNPPVGTREVLPKINKQWDAKLLHKLSTVKGAVKKNVLIWYHGDGHWYKGKFISKVLGCYQVEFRLRCGSRNRIWYKILRGFIAPNTRKARKILRDHNAKLVKSSGRL